MKFSLYITQQRLNNVLSKIGKVTDKEFSTVAGELLKDAKTEFERDELDEIEIDKSDWRVLSKQLYNLSMSVVRYDWVNTINR
jgi:Rnl2 family RNA ligase